MRDFIQESKFLLIFFVLLTALTGVTHLESQPLAETPTIDQIKQVSYVQPRYLNRGPASISPEASGANLSKNFFCNHSYDREVPPTRVQKNLLMMSFKVCKDSKLIDHVSLVNETNGFKAQIFKPTTNQYKTDYIQLNEGSNNITVEIILKDGQINRESLVILTGS